MPVVRVGRGVTATVLRYERAGTGEPLLLVTGFAISSEIFTLMSDRFVDRFDTLRYDNRGSGRSAAPWRPTSMAELAGDAVGLLDALGIDSAHVYGLSMGGMIAQEIAIRFPHRVRGLVLGATTPGGPRAVLPASLALAALGSRGAPPRVRANVVADALFSPEFRERNPDRVRAALTLLGRHRATLRGLNAHWWASFYHDTYARLPRIKAPTLVLHGERDLLTPPANARILATRIPDATLAVIPGAGHAYFVERPDESFAAFRDWLDRRGPIPAGPTPSAIARAAEPITRALGLPAGMMRTGRSMASLPGAYLNRMSRRASGRSAGRRAY